MLWLRDNAAATRCGRQQCLLHASAVSGPGCPDDAFWVSGLSGLQQYLGGWAYAPENLRQTKLQDELPDPALAVAGSVARQPGGRREADPGVADQTSEAEGVDWVVADLLAGPVSPALDQLAVRRFSNGGVRIYRLAVSTLVVMATEGVEVDRPTRERAAIGEDGRSRDRTRPALPDPLPMSVVDAHCHLDIADGEDGNWLGAAEAIKLASSVGVTRIVQVGCDLPGAVWAVEAAEQYPGLIAGVALHPNETPRLAATGELDSALQEIERLAKSSDKVRVIGESGLDYYRTGEDGRAAQHESFAAHIELAKRLDKTLMIHDRDAHDDILAVLDREGVPDRLVMHCFSGDTEFARECVDRGAFLSFAGVVTFKNAQSLRDALAVTPLDRVLVETDAPYLTPSPHRGQPNASYLIPHTVRKMAGVLNISVAELCGALSDNANRAFGGSW